MDKYFQSKATVGGWVVRLIVILGFLFVSAGSAPFNYQSASHGLSALPVSAVAGCEADKVTVTGVHSFKDTQGAWRVVGVINNRSSQMVSKVVTGVETKDKNGQPVDQGEDVSAYPLNLQPGSQAPFTAWIDRDIPGLDHFEVEVDECVLAEQVKRGTVDVRAGQLQVENVRTAEVTAELFNHGSTPVLVNGLMAAVYDKSDTLITAEYVVVTPRYLAPGESGPVRASLDLPPNSAGQIKSYKFFMDVLPDQNIALPPGIKQNIQIIKKYVDNTGHFHLLSQIKNTGSKELMTSIQATVYSDSTKTSVVDAAYFNTRIPLEPGDTLPFDLTEWGVLNNDQALWKKINKNQATIELRIEPFLTWMVDAKVTRLSVMDNKVIYKDQQVIFTGNVINDTGKDISNGLVTAEVRQKSDGVLVAVGSLNLDNANQSSLRNNLKYNLVVSLPAKIDPAALETLVTAVDYQP